MSAKRGIFVAPFDELVNPATVSELANLAEQCGWEGFFLWDHVTYSPPVQAVADPWIALAAIACRTERLRIGPLVTPLARRRVQKLARETVSLDLLSGGRLTLGVGLGGDGHGEFGPFGDSADPRERARLLDTGLERLGELWAGEFQPGPVQQPRIPVWVAGRWPKRLPLRRAVQWDGFFPIDLERPDDLAASAAEIRDLRADRNGPFDLVCEISPGGDPEPWEAAGATWVLTGIDSPPRLEDARAVVESGPR